MSSPPFSSLNKTLIPWPFLFQHALLPLTILEAFQWLLQHVRVSFLDQQAQNQVLVDNKLNYQGTLVAKMFSHTMDCCSKTAARRWKDVIIPLCSALVRPHLEYWVQHWAPQCKEKIIYCAKYNMVRCPECMTVKERMGTVSPTLKNRRLGKTLLPSLMAGDTEDTDRLFSEVHRVKTRDYRYKMQYRKFWLGIRKKKYHKSGQIREDCRISVLRNTWNLMGHDLQSLI